MPNARAEVQEYLASLIDSGRIRDDTLAAILAMRDAGGGTLVLQVPQAQGRPVDGSTILGRARLRMTVEQDL